MKLREPNHVLHIIIGNHLNFIKQLSSFIALHVLDLLLDMFL